MLAEGRQEGTHVACAVRFEALVGSTARSCQRFLDTVERGANVCQRNLGRSHHVWKGPAGWGGQGTWTGSFCVGYHVVEKGKGANVGPRVREAQQTVDAKTLGVRPVHPVAHGQDDGKRGAELLGRAELLGGDTHVNARPCHLCKIFVTTSLQQQGSERVVCRHAHCCHVHEEPFGDRKRRHYLLLPLVSAVAVPLLNGSQFAVDRDMSANRSELVDRQSPAVQATNTTGQQRR
mmetsp:Transcript_13783/g.43399  ORF Transcript_13783/g.43399 Transcript_13783/m.43399 type:complete len:234 (+) Transcript_13783:1141-1842(+)